ncbi:MAG: hypothetical protein ACE5PO_08720 [Candidatus Bathyarchaeia archaeon]
MISGIESNERPTTSPVEVDVRILQEPEELLLMNHGYVIVNDDHIGGRVVCDEECRVYQTIEDAEQEASSFRQRYGNQARVYELQAPETLYRLSTDDVYLMAREMGIPESRVTPRMYQIQKGIEWGFEDWHHVVREAIRDAVC